MHSFCKSLILLLLLLVLAPLLMFFFFVFSRKAFNETLLVEKALQLYKETLLHTKMEILGIAKEVPHRVVTPRVLIAPIKKYLRKYPRERHRFLVVPRRIL